VLMVAEIALSVMLVAGAGWLVRSFANLRTVDPGFTAANRFFFDVSFTGPKYPNSPAVTAAADDLLDRVRNLGGVDAAGATANIPLRLTPQNSLFVQIEGQPFDPRNPFGSRQRIVGPGFFDAMGVKLIAGRDFTRADRGGSTPVAIVNRSFAKKYLPNRDPLGVSFMWGYPTIDPQTKTLIVGVVEDVRQKALTDAPEPSFYSSDGQFPARRRTVVVHSTRSDIGSLQGAIRAEVGKIDPQIAVDFTSVSDYLMESLLRQQLGMRLMLIFGAAALALAAVGIYGVIAYAASQRQGEVATRLALGATQGAVFWLVLRQGRLLALIGTGIGLIGSYLAGRVLSAGLFEVRASDPAILMLATVTVMVIALVATMIPALRVARVDPARVLRPE
jgi:putative ABC transport system permease protein